MSGTNLKEFREDGTKIDYSNCPGFRDAVKMEGATPRHLITRCVSLANRRSLESLFSQMGITKDTKMVTVHSDYEWEQMSLNGKYTYLICSMGNFMIIGGNGFSYSSGPIHKDAYIYKDIRNLSNAMIVIEHTCDNYYEPKRSISNRPLSLVEEAEEIDYLYHPDTKHKPQKPVYNKKTCRYELKCSICGNTYDEMDVHEFYSGENGYRYECKHCTTHTSTIKRLSYMERIAKATNSDLDNYSFDGE